MPREQEGPSRSRYEWYDDGIIPRGGIAPWTPSSLTHAVGRYKAKEIVGLLDTDPVSTFEDLIGSADLVGAGVARPLYHTNAGDPYVEFDGVDDQLNATVTALTDFSILFILELPSDTGVQLAWEYSGITFRNNHPSALFQFFYPGGESNNHTPIARPTGFMSLYVERVGLIGRSRINGVQVSQAVAATTTGTAFRAGGDLSGLFQASRVKEIVVCDAGFEAGEEALLATYINDEYGLTL